MIRLASTICIVIFFGTLFASAQEVSNLVQKRLVLTNDTIQLDSNSVAPGSLTVRCGTILIEEDTYWVESLGSKFLYLGDRCTGDTATFTYRRLPLSFTRELRKKDLTLIEESRSNTLDPFKYRPKTQKDDLFGLQGLTKTGSISRGVLFGNNQDLAVNSTFNLELAGKLTEDLHVIASVTDNTIPIQANGNTLELQDFDQVFIKLFDKSRELIAGDMVLGRPKSHFLNYFKKAQGVSYKQNIIGKDEHAIDVGVAGAISKGRFARNQIQGVENNQGPYPLTGAANEQFIIVLSGTEQVYMDGQELVRGQENDYIIDYNTAEITFTARRLITKDKRIVVEFQYSDRNYTRSLVTATSDIDLGKTNVGFHFYSEQDHRNQPLQQDIQDAERSILAMAGDDPFQAITNGVDSVGSDNTLVLYRETDSLGYAPVYVFETDPATALFRLTFSEVGAGNGDYVQNGFVASGRVFKWLAPDTINGTIVRNGDHAPIRVLVAPQAQQMILLNIDHKSSEKTRVFSELAYTNFDRNTLSTLDSGDDQGVAALFGIEHAFPLDTVKGWSLLTHGQLEFRNRNFERVERYRPVEFERNWNIIGLVQEEDQLLGALGLALRNKKGDLLSYSLNSYSIQEQFSGLRHTLGAQKSSRKFDLNITGSFLDTRKSNTSSFLRHKSVIKRKFKGFSVGFQDEHELNRLFNNARDSLQVGSYQFYDWAFFVQSPDTFQNKYRIQFGKRQDLAFSNSGLSKTTDASNLTASVELAKNLRNKLRASITYRQLRVLNDTLTSASPENTYLGRIEYDLIAFKGLLSLDVFYELGAGAEQRKEFIYVEVPAGQGVYVWIDYNNDDVRDLNEFEIAQFSYEANFIRVFVPTNDFVTTYSDQFSVAVDLRPRSIWSGEEGLKKFISKFNNQTALRNDRRTGNDLEAALNLFNLNELDTNLLSFNSSLRNSIFYDRTSRKWSANFTIQKDETKSNLVNGSETRGRSSQRLGLRWNTTEKFTFNMEYETGAVFSRSNLLTGRTYNVDLVRTEPQLTWQPNTRFRASTAISLTEKSATSEAETGIATLNEIELQARLSEPGKGSIEFTLSYINIDYNGTENNSLGNEVLQGLRVGNNATWGLSIQRNLSKNLQIDLTYNGRRSENNRAIHVGGMQLRAFF